MLQNQIVLVLNGKVALEAPGEAPKKFRIGQVCGATELFQAALAKPENFVDSIPLYKETLVVKKCASILCMKFKDYYQAACCKDTTNHDLVDQVAIYMNQKVIR